nr:MAG TPA: hypothetical protein [Caudoviricetes sp.]
MDRQTLDRLDIVLSPFLCYNVCDRTCDKLLSVVVVQYAFDTRCILLTILADPLRYSLPRDQ